MAVIYGRTRHIDTIDGTGGSDIIYGWDPGWDPEAADFMRDTLNGGGGDDYLYGGGGADILNGGPDNDTLYGGAGGDRLDGGEGTDTAKYNSSPAAVFINLGLGTGFGGHAEADTLISIENVGGSAHDDVIVGADVRNIIDGWYGDDRIYGEGGDDDLYGHYGIDRLYGGEGDDLLDGGEGDDYLYGGSADDTFIGSAGADRNYGSSGVDRVSYASSTSGVGVDLVTGLGRSGFAEGDQYSGIENVTGSRFDDRITGDAGHNVLFGGGGVDVLFGGEGDDLLVGGAGGDELDGGGNTAAGDRISYEGSVSGVWVDLARGEGRFGDAEGDKFVRIEDLTGSSHRDYLFGDSGSNTLEGMAGSDELHGGDSVDILVGGANDDRLWGDGRSDHLWGGTGADTFMYNTLSDSFYAPPGGLGVFDIIHDFNHSESDSIDLSVIDADTTADGNQSFVWTSDPTLAAGRLRIDRIEDGWNVIGEINGDGYADFMIRVHGHGLDASDFIM